MPLELPDWSNLLDKYAAVIDSIIELCSHVDDARTFALVWTTNYIRLYETPGQDNDKLLARYLRWRFDELAGLCPVSTGVGQ